MLKPHVDFSAKVPGREHKTLVVRPYNLLNWTQVGGLHLLTVHFQSNHFRYSQNKRFNAISNLQYQPQRNVVRTISGEHHQIRNVCIRLIQSSASKSQRQNILWSYASTISRAANITVSPTINKATTARITWSNTLKTRSNPSLNYLRQIHESTRYGGTTTYRARSLQTCEA